MPLNPPWKALLKNWKSEIDFKINSCRTIRLKILDETASSLFSRTALWCKTSKKWAVGVKGKRKQSSYLMQNIKIKWAVGIPIFLLRNFQRFLETQKFDNKIDSVSVTCGNSRTWSNQINSVFSVSLCFKKSSIYCSSIAHGYSFHHFPIVHSLVV